MARDLSHLGLGFDTINIEEDSALVQTYGEAIPVLLNGDEEIARAPQTSATLAAALRQAGLLPETRRP